MSLNEPPTITSAGMNRYVKPDTPRTHDLTYCGLDFYHTSGKIEFLERNTTVFFEPGDVGVTGPGETIRVTDFSDRESVYIQFLLPDRHGSGELLPTLMNLGDRFDVLQESAVEIVRCSQSQPHRAQALLWAVLWEIAHYCETVVREAEGCHPCVHEAVEIIEVELSRKLSLDYLARRVSLSSSRLSRLFHEHMGLPLMEYVRKRRISRACLMLKNTDLTVADIALRVGISDTRVFYAAFRKQVGASPGTFRGAG